MTGTATLTATQQRELIDSVHNFRQWLAQALSNGVLENYEHFLCISSTEEDWIMRVNSNARIVEFNPAVTARCSLAYFEMIVIHECFHLFAQRLPNKAEARMIKASFGNHMMKALDIEADFYTALYLRDVKGATLIDVLAHYSEGSRVFGDPRILNWKFERFIGSILSICNVFLTSTHLRHPAATDLFIPTLDGVHTEDRIFVVRFRGSHCSLIEIAASYQDFVNLKRAYTNKDELTPREYVSLVLGFASSGLGLTVPPDVESELLALPGVA
ncbi:MAG: hypothetical protein V4757_22260 [Pseudomonadota bacterium]